ncbi:biopolymer transporter ExbB [Oceanomicrobium pacificus]|uniref:Biopolymer transporter ExbB n=1 Tax=Oceanomicrobium pacificus TaxID=2692916 RepID=A0A6B0TR30_9RHOB|nr:biopolymer transporter ExbB [Oceanomicrobium pacificus]MXU64255.1 biopolymer transporter ExbB [Oceanomicrobium pacificus]
MKLDTHHEPQFSQPIRQIVIMLMILGAVTFGGVLAYPSIAPVFLASPYLNGVIVAVFVLGVLACFAQVFQLVSSVNWIEGFALNRPGHEFIKAPLLLASLSALLSDQRARNALTSTSTRSILDSVATRLDEARDITRYIINLLIFLGLLGTFYGLATTVPAVVDTIRTLAPQEDGNALGGFSMLMNGLEQQLGGMGTAFASSLLGLAGSLVVGLLELFAGHGQNRFYRELEEWLSSITRISFSSGDGDDSVSSVGDLIEQSAYQIESLRDFIQRAEERRIQTDGKLGSLADAVNALAMQMQSAPQNQPQSGQPVDAQLVSRLAESQDRLAAGQERFSVALERLIEGQSRMVAGQDHVTHLEDRGVQAMERVARVLETQGEDTGALDSEMRMRLRNIDVQLLRILEEMSAGRQDTLAELRQDMAALVQALRSGQTGG